MYYRSKGCKSVWDLSSRNCVLSISCWVRSRLASFWYVFLFWQPSRVCLQGSYLAKFIHISQKYFCISAYWIKHIATEWSFAFKELRLAAAFIAIDFFITLVNNRLVFHLVNKHVVRWGSRVISWISPIIVSRLTLTVLYSSFWRIVAHIPAEHNRPSKRFFIQTISKMHA